MSRSENFVELYPLNFTTPSGNLVFSTQILNYALLDILLQISYFMFTGPFSLMGTFTNIANIIVFCKMGFAESANVNFLVLSVFDFFVSLTSLVGRGLFNPVFQNLSSGPLFRYIGHCLSHAMIGVICGSTMMTALISAERCVCVVFPLKVKTLLSRKRSFYLMLMIVAYHVAFVILIYSDPGPPYDAHPKKMAFYYFSLYVIPTTTCYFVVVFTTFILVINLRRNQQWRQRSLSSQSDRPADKEDKLVRTIIAISTLLIICSFPNVAIFITQLIFPEFHYTSPHLGTLVLLMFSYGGVFQAVSSSVNIFFYYRMSSRYKRVLLVCFYCRPKTESDGLSARTIE